MTTNLCKIPFLKIMVMPFVLFSENLKSFFIIASFYALILSVLAGFLGNSYSCMYGTGLYCSQSEFNFIIFFLLKLFVVAVFMTKWVAVIIEKQKIDLNVFAEFNLRIVKTFGLILAILAVFFMPVLSFYLLYIRVPNPIWQIELVYFAVVSIGFLLPFLALRWTSLFAFTAKGQTLPKPGVLWQKTKGNIAAILFSMFVIFMVFLLALTFFDGSLRALGNDLSIYHIVIYEFLYNIIYLIVIAFFINNCIIQQNYLFKENENACD